MCLQGSYRGSLTKPGIKEATRDTGSGHGPGPTPRRKQEDRLWAGNLPAGISAAFSAVWELNPPLYCSEKCEQRRSLEASDQGQGKGKLQLRKALPGP